MISVTVVQNQIQPIDSVSHVTQDSLHQAQELVKHVLSMSFLLILDHVLVILVEQDLK